MDVPFIQIVSNAADAARRRKQGRELKMNELPVSRRARTDSPRKVIFMFVVYSVSWNTLGDKVNNFDGPSFSMSAQVGTYPR